MKIRLAVFILIIKILTVSLAAGQTTHQIDTARIQIVVSDDFGETSSADSSASAFGFYLKKQLARQEKILAKQAIEMLYLYSQNMVRLFVDSTLNKPLLIKHIAYIDANVLLLHWGNDAEYQTNQQWFNETISAMRQMQLITIEEIEAARQKTTRLKFLYNPAEKRYEIIDVIEN